jgi:hypothetical protein
LNKLPPRPAVVKFTPGFGNGFSFFDDCLDLLLGRAFASSVASFDGDAEPDPNIRSRAAAYRSALSLRSSAALAFLSANVTARRRSASASLSSESSAAADLTVSPVSEGAGAVDLPVLPFELGLGGLRAKTLTAGRIAIPLLNGVGAGDESTERFADRKIGASGAVSLFWLC